MSNENGKEKKPFSVKEFFKSTSFKCIAVLLAIVLVCGILLTICNSLFKVTDQERFDRVISQIYGKPVSTEEVELDELETKFDNGTINSAYKVKDDGNYLVNASGTGGFGGTVTCWVVVEITDGAVSGIGNVVIESSQGETYLNKIPDAAFDYYSKNYEDGEAFDVADIKNEGLTGGATLSMTAITNSVNTAVDFVKSQVLGEVIDDPFEDFAYTKYIDKTNTTVALDGSSLVYHVTTTGYAPAGAFKIDITMGEDKKISAYEIKTNGSTGQSYIDKMPANVKDGSLFKGKSADELLTLLGGADSGFTDKEADEALTGGATRSSVLCTYAALFAVANYDNAYMMALQNSLVNTVYIDLENTTATADGTTLNYTVVTLGLSPAGSFTINVSVGEDKKISEYTIKSNGSTDQAYIDKMPANVKDGSLFKGKTAEELLTLLGGADSGFTSAEVDESLKGGATRSSILCTYAALFAASNYDVYLKLAELSGPAFVNTVYIDLDKTTYTVNGDNVVYTVETLGYRPAGAFTIEITVGADKKISAYEIKTNGSTDQSYIDKMPANVKDGSLFKGKTADELIALLGGAESGFTDKEADEALTGGATRSSVLCTYAALFAVSNYDICKGDTEPSVNFVNTQYIDVENTTYTINGDNIVYSIVTTAYRPAKAFTIEITVGADKKISAYEIKINGSTAQSYIDKMPANVKDGSLFKGKTADELIALLGGADSGFTDQTADEALKCEATRSSILCTYAALFAVSNYSLLGGAQE